MHAKGKQVDKEVKQPAESNAEQLAVEPTAKQAVSKTDGSSEWCYQMTGMAVLKHRHLRKKLAEEKGINIADVPGSGDNGRVTKKDIDSYVPSKRSSVHKKLQPRYLFPKDLTGEVNFEDVPVSQMRKTIAKRLSESKFSAPEFYLTIAINMDKAVASRDKLNESISG